MIRTAKFGALVAAVALASACSSSTSGTTGTVSGTSGTTSGTGTGTTSGSSGTTSGTSGTTDAGVNCNGIEFATASGTDVYMATYPKSDEIRVNCTHALIDPYYDGGSTIGNLSGILDRNTNALQGTLYTVWPAGCDDLDAGPAPIAGTVVADGGMTIAAMVAQGLAGSTPTTGTTLAYGVVTFLTAPYESDGGDQHSGTMWVQDPVAEGATPAPNSGVSIYFYYTSANDGGKTGNGYFPVGTVNRGDVVALSGLTWSPYIAKGNTNGLQQSQFEFKGTGASIVDIGAGALPPPVPLTAAEFSADGGMFMGMRVIQTDGPDTTTNSCPVVLQSPVDD